MLNVSPPPGATSDNDTIVLLNGSAYDGLVPYSPGSFDPSPLQNDAYIDAVLTEHCLVSMNPSNLTLNVTNVSGHTLYISRGVRFWNFGKPLTAYANPLGRLPGVTVTTDPNTGRAACYLREYRYDYIVTISGEAPRLFIDAVGSFVMR